MDYKQPGYNEPINQMKERIKGASTWFPYPVLIPVMLAIVLNGYAIPNLNIYFGQPSTLIEQEIVEGKTPSGSIWLSVSLVGTDLVVSTYDRKVFRWNREIESITKMSEFTSYLQREIQRRSVQAGLAAGIRQGEVSVTVAVDRGLKYLHIRPIINALAAAGISNYSFETKIKDISKSSESEVLKTL